MSRQPPRLRNGVDLQLQSAFQDGNWPVAMRLAEKRARTLQDQYFEVVKICAESQLDDPAAKFAAVAAVDQLVKDEAVVKDVDAIDLLEWAALDLMREDDYAETLGPLRVRAVKASPKNRDAATRCLESCLLHWDLVSAQQIAAILDRSFPGDRGFLFWNVAITHLLATSTQCPREKQKLYGMLAHKQIERAAQLTEQARATAATDQPPTLPARGVQTEQEIMLLYDIVKTHGAAGDFDKMLASPVFSPVSQFRLGRKEPFLKALVEYQREAHWGTVFDLCHDCLSDADEDDEPTMLACDWLVWRHFIEAASHLKSVRSDAPDAVQRLLLALIKSKNLLPMYRRNLLLARVSAAFHLGSGDEEDLQDDQPSSLRLRELIHYIEDQRASSACFNDVKQFVERLSGPAAKFIAYHHVPRLADAEADQTTAARLRLLSLKLRYFVATCPLSAVRVPGERPTSSCAVCAAGFAGALCPSCLSSISREALGLHSATAQSMKGSPAAENEILPELALAVAICNLRLAFNGAPPGYTSSAPPCTQHLLRALFTLERQLRLTPKHASVSLVLVQLHLMLGSAHRAREVWDDLAVKRTIVDSLAPLFFDRLSAIAPAVLSPSDGGGRHLMDTLVSHYDVSLRLRMPRRLIDALEAGSYDSFLEIPRCVEKLRASCTRAMGLVEESRTERLLGLASRGVLNDARFDEVPDELCLNAVIDYGSFPSWDYSGCPPLYSLLRIGPPPSNERFHLALLAEAYHDVLNPKPPSIYKASAAVGGTDQVFVLEMMAQLGHSFSKFLRDGGPKCNSSEMMYFEAVSLLCTLIPFCTGTAGSSPPPSVLASLTEPLLLAMESLGDDDVSVPGGHELEQAASTLMSLHRIAMLRDTAVAVKLASRWILEFNERERERDRSGKSNLPKEVVVQIKSLHSAAEKALKGGKERVQGLKSGEVATGRNLVARLRGWVFDDDDDEPGASVEDDDVWELVDSWRKSIAGWQLVKWE